MKLTVNIEIETNYEIDVKALMLNINTEYDEIVLFNDSFEYGNNNCSYLSSKNLFKNATIKRVAYND